MTPTRPRDHGGVGSNQYATKGTATTPASRSSAGSTARAAAGSDHVLRVAAAMEPDPTEWAFTGRCVDLGANGGTCACGTSIRWAFPITRDRDQATLTIGSVCIEQTVPWLIDHGAADLAERLESAAADHEQTLRSAQQQTRRTAAARTVESLTAEIDELNAWTREQPAPWGMRPRPVEHPEPSSTPGRTAVTQRRRYATGWVAAVTATAAHPEGCTRTPPLPADPETREKLAAALDEHIQDRVAAADRYDQEVVTWTAGASTDGHDDGWRVVSPAQCAIEAESAARAAEKIRTEIGRLSLIRAGMADAAPR